jgi:hypothetical protein
MSQAFLKAFLNFLPPSGLATRQIALPRSDSSATWRSHAAADVSTALDDCRWRLRARVRHIVKMCRAG